MCTTSESRVMEICYAVFCGTIQLVLCFVNIEY